MSYDWVHGRLVRWANWHLRDLERSDFPTTTALYWIMRQKKTDQGQSGRTAVAREMTRRFGSRVMCRDLPKDIWPTHLAIVRVSAIHQRAIAAKYMLIQNAAGCMMTDAGRARLFGISNAAFRKRVERAKFAVGEKIEEIEDAGVTS